MMAIIEGATWFLGLLAVALFVVLVWLEVKSNRKLYCRGCSCKLDGPGGYVVPFFGSGFCAKCARELMRHANDQ